MILGWDVYSDKNPNSDFLLYRTISIGDFMQEYECTQLLKDELSKTRRIIIPKRYNIKKI